MPSLDDLLPSLASILRSDPALGRLAPNWAADDARAHVFVGQPPAGAANAGRAPFIVVDLADVRHGPVHSSDQRDAATTATVALRLVARRGVDELAGRVVRALSTDAARTLGDAHHVLGFAIERGPAQRRGLCQETTLRLTVRLLTEPGA